MYTSISRRMDASPEVVFALARNIERWPELLPHYLRVTVRARAGDRALAQMVAVRRIGPVPVPVTWRAVFWADGSDPADLRLRFRHVRGATRGMNVTWHIRPVPGDLGRSDVTIEHDFSRPVPLLSALPVLGAALGPDLLPGLVDRVFTRPIAGRTLGAFKRHVARANPRESI